MKKVIEKAHPTTKPTKANLKLFIFGHSLGGANTTVFSYFYQYWKAQMSTVLQAPYLNVPLYVVSWGSPRVGTKIFARDYYTLMSGENKIHHIRAKTDGDLIPEIPKTVNLLKKENAFFHVGEDVSIKDQSPFQCNSRLNVAKTGLNYNKPLQCDNRFSCSTVKFMFAHTNAAYVSFLNILRSASIGAMIKKGYLMAVYNDMRGVSNKGMIKGYGKNFLMSLGDYQKEFSTLEGKNLEVSPHPGTVDGKTRISSLTEFGTFFKGEQPAGMISRDGIKWGLNMKTKKKLGGKNRKRSRKKRKSRKRSKRKRSRKKHRN